MAQAEKKELNLELLSTLQFEMSSGSIIIWHVSPSGDNHIVVAEDRCLLINIYGAMPIRSDYLFVDGELSVESIYWIEEDNLVLFDVYYIVHNKVRKCICHYSNNSNAFFYFTAIQKCDNNAPVPKYTEEPDWGDE